MNNSNTASFGFMCKKMRTPLQNNISISLLLYNLLRYIVTHDIMIKK
jgi:hypothetical protein